MLHEPGSTRRSILLADSWRTQLSGDGSCGTITGEIAGAVCGIDEVDNQNNISAFGVDGASLPTLLC